MIRNSDFTPKFTGEKERDLLRLYNHWTDAQRGTDRDFVATVPSLTESTLRKKLRKWRDNVKLLKDPVTGKPTENPLSSSVPPPIKNAPSVPSTVSPTDPPTADAPGTQRTHGRQAPSATDQDTQAADFTGMSADEQAEHAQTLLEGSTALAAETLQELMKDATPAIRERIATGILKARGLAKEGDRVRDRSEFETWPKQALVDLLADLAPDVLAGRREPDTASALPAVIAPGP